jgi:hypothetical protein
MVLLVALTLALVVLGQWYWHLGLYTLYLLAVPLALAVVYLAWYRTLPLARPQPRPAAAGSASGDADDEPFEDPVEEADRLEEGAEDEPTPEEPPEETPEEADDPPPAEDPDGP